MPSPAKASKGFTSSIAARASEVAHVVARSTMSPIRLPAAVPVVFTGIRYGLTHAWMALVAVELLASSEGLGYLLVWGRQMFWYDTVVLAMVATQLNVASIWYVSLVAATGAAGHGAR